MSECWIGNSWILRMKYIKFFFEFPRSRLFWLDVNYVEMSYVRLIG